MPDHTKKRRRTCPKCGKVYAFVSIEEFKPYPFCSERCRLIDLGSWLNEEYQIAKNLQDETDLNMMDTDGDSMS